MTPLITTLADEQKSQAVTDWAARAAWVVGLLLFVALMYWLMREGWKWRGTLQGDLPELPAVPEEPGETRLSLAGRYHGSTTAVSGSTASWPAVWAPAAVWSSP
ncbi:hypothetical protein GCM10020221_04320 [Streptomyces thioluteus]|uniref:Uncharacterized protein n=1 Tax=Streptomyces thioluteus TaxID=66431 RepID=A0ABN3WDX3_STRTU